MNRDDDKTENLKYVRHILLVTAVILLPGLLGAVFGWVHGLLPLLVFYYLRRYGQERGKKFIFFGCLLAGIAGIAFQIIEQLLFSLTLIPMGFVLADSVKNKESIHVAGIKGTVALAGSWVLATTILTFGMDHHPYSLLITTLNQGMDEAIAYYKVNKSVPADTLLVLEQAFATMKIWIPKIMPGVLTCITLLITCFTMVIGNRMLHKNTGSGPWQEFKFWALPEKLIWALIISAILVILPMDPGRALGMNILMIAGLLYCFQGTAIMLFYLSKWSVPLFLRTFIYILLFFQTFGVILLGVLGVADVWTDLRKLKSTEQEKT
ncbi:MAG TPA: DUF2232 domain-containing protein [Desulfobacterales bacterium]|nr:DUF2232 domain-containing protein [Desulfobacterales bacterium]HIP38179.1 DUF2232 domain-containing protein [Desulfocapsa sulfexigens]